MHQPGKTRSRTGRTRPRRHCSKRLIGSTGCRTCRIRKVKCDEEKQRIQGRDEPQCNKCVAARIGCEWKGGPIPRKSPSTSSTKKSRNWQFARNATDSKRIVARQSQQKPSEVGSNCLIPQRIGYESHTQTLQAANSLTLSAFDRDCINYLQDSTLVVLLGKHWPWSTISYAYHRIAINEPMVMSMMLASAAREIRRSQLYDQEGLSEAPSNILSCELDGSMHYGRALSSLRHALKQGVTSLDKIEAVYVTLWLMIDYENRFGNGAPAINIHIRAIQSMLQDHVVPLLQNRESRQGQAAISISDDRSPQEDRLLAMHENTKDLDLSPASPSISLNGLQCTSVPLFFLWTLYFFTPGALFLDSLTSKLDTDIFQSFFGTEAHTNGPLELPELYRINRQSPSRFWGDSYSLSAQLDDVENLPGLALYHRSHVLQFKTTELFKSGCAANVAWEGKGCPPYQWIIDEIQTLSVVRLASLLILFMNSGPAHLALLYTDSDSGVRYSPHFRPQITILRHWRPAPPGPGNELLGRNHLLQHNRILPPLLAGYPQPRLYNARAEYPHVAQCRGVPGPRAESEVTSEPTPSGRADYLATVHCGHSDLR